MNYDLPVNLHVSDQLPIGAASTAASVANFEDVPKTMDFSSSVCQVHTTKISANPLRPFLPG